MADSKTRRARKAFLQLVNAIDRRSCAINQSKDVIAFTINESKIDFSHGEEHLAIDWLRSNLYEVAFPLTPAIYEQLLQLAEMVQYPTDKLLILRKLVSYPPIS